MVTQPEGFWLAGTPGRREAEQNNFNAQLLQMGTTIELNALVDKLGMHGYDSTLRRFVTNDGTDMIPLQLIQTGLDANKPTSGSTNNGRLYLATDTLILYGVIDGTVYTLASGNVSLTLSDSDPTEVALGATSTEGTGNSASRFNHQHNLRVGTPVDISDSNAEGTSDRVPRLDHQHQHPTGLHERGGDVPIDGDKLDIDYNPSGYSPDSSISQADNVDDLSAHLKGLSNKLDNLPFKMQSLTQAEYSAIVTKDPDTLYFTPA